MSEYVAIIIIIICYGLSIYFKLISIENKLNNIEHIKLGRIEDALVRMSKEKEE